MARAISIMNSDLPLAGWKDPLLLVLRLRTAFVVDGESMSPVLKSGDKVLVDPKASFAAGDIVLARHPFRIGMRIIKRVAEITSTGDYFLSGDNPIESTDSRTLGMFRPNSILGKVVCKVN